MAEILSVKEQMIRDAGIVQFDYVTFRPDETISHLLKPGEKRNFEYSKTHGAGKHLVVSSREKQAGIHVTKILTPKGEVEIGTWRLMKVAP